MVVVEVLTRTLMFTMSAAIICKSLRLRGAGDSDSNPAYNKSEYLESRKFRYPGLPCIDFMERYGNPYMNALGAIQQNGSTILQTVQQVDEGGVFGNPSRAVAPQDVVQRSKDRNVRAFSIILNYFYSINKQLFQF